MRSALELGTQCPEDLLHVLGQRCREGHALARARMGQRELHGMQRLPLDGKRAGLARPVLGIAEHGMPDARHVHADLVRAARLQAALDERVVAEALEHGCCRRRWPSRCGAPPLCGSAPRGRDAPRRSWPRP